MYNPFVLTWRAINISSRTLSCSVLLILLLSIIERKRSHIEHLAKPCTKFFKRERDGKQLQANLLNAVRGKHWLCDQKYRHDQNEFTFLKIFWNTSCVISSQSFLEKAKISGLGLNKGSLCGLENLFHGQTSWQTSQPKAQSSKLFFRKLPKGWIRRRVHRTQTWIKGK